MGRCRALLAHGTGVLVGDGEGTGLGLGRGLGDRGGGGVNESVGVGGPGAGGVAARRGEGEAGRVGARRLGGSVPGITGLVVGCPAVGAGLAEGDGPTQQVRGAVDGGGDQPLILLGGATWRPSWGSWTPRSSAAEVGSDKVPAEESAAASSV